MTDDFAYSFTSPLSLADIRLRLNGLGPWRWIERDNDQFGEYISTRVLTSPDYGMIKVFSEPDHYAINVLLGSEDACADARFGKIRDTLFKQLLPAIEASNIAPTETYE